MTKYVGKISLLNVKQWLRKIFIILGDTFLARAVHKFVYCMQYAFRTHTDAIRSLRRDAVMCRGKLGRLAAWHLPGGPVGPVSRWAATSNIKKKRQTTYPVNTEVNGGREGREGSEGQRHNDKEGKGVSEMGEGDQGPLNIGRGFVLKYLLRCSPSSELRHCWWVCLLS